jgi:type IV pilus assembly protein PilW
MRPFVRGQRGLSLTELMIALTLGSFVTIATLSLFSSTRKNHHATEALSRAQENGRFAIDLLTRELRQTGYAAGCPEPNNLLDPEAEAYLPELYDLSQPVAGWINDDDNLLGLTNRLPDTDILLVKHASSVVRARASGNTPPHAANVSLTGASGVNAGQIVLIADSEGCDLFQNRSNQNASNLNRAAGGTPGNLVPANAPLSHAYGTDLDIHLLESTAYYIGTGTTGLPSLRYRPFHSGPQNNQELVSGIAHMRVCYGVDTDDDQEVDEYASADAVTEWRDVRALRLSLVAIGTLPGSVDAPQQVILTECDGNETSIEVADRHHAVVFTTTVALRNALP